MHQRQYAVPSAPLTLGEVHPNHKQAALKLLNIRHHGNYKIKLKRIQGQSLNRKRRSTLKLEREKALRKKKTENNRKLQWKFSIAHLDF